MNRALSVHVERWPVAGSGFAIARGRKTEAEVVVVEIAQGSCRGRGECVPYPRYGEAVGSVVATIEALAPEIEQGLDRAALASRARGAARSGIDLALWELEAALEGTTVAKLAGLAPPAPFATAITIPIDTPEAVGTAARRLASQARTIKLKVAGDGLDLARARAVREGAPEARLWLDANEAWDLATYEALVPHLGDLGVALLEQPLPASCDGALCGRPRPVPLCADESAHGDDTIAALADRYDAVNVKLDKAGGLTGAIGAIEAARAAGLKVVLGCMVSTSLAIAPACLLVPRADLVDLDGPLLLARDREGGMRARADGLVEPPMLWG